MNDMQTDRIPACRWTIIDVAAVFCGVLAAEAIIVILCISVIGSEKAALRLSRYLGGILLMLIPVYWVNKRYALRVEALGLRRTCLHVRWMPFAVLLSALVYCVTSRLILVGAESLHSNMNISENFLAIVMLPFSIDGFPSIILSPIGEEILYRGFVYGWLRTRFGILVGIITQSLVFSFFHYDIIQHDWLYISVLHSLAGLILGLLFEISGNLYVSIVGHSAMNYLGVIFGMNWK